MTLFVPLAKSCPVGDPQAEAQRLPSPGIDCSVMPQSRVQEVSMTVKPLPGEEIMEVFNRLAMALKELEATIAHLIVFGNVSAGAAGMEAMRRIFGGVDWPVTWVEGAVCDGGPIAGLHASAFAGGQVQRIRMGGRVVASVFEDTAFRHCLLGGLGPYRNSSPCADQTKQTLDNLAEALAQGGFSFADVVRTWFFLDDILSWYDEFNQTRTQIYSGIKFRTGSLPASTGVGGRNPAAAALAVGAWAIQPLNAPARAGEIGSPLQCPAPAYGSSFSRAMEISSVSGRRLLISGTASISHDGKTLWKANPGRQVKRTMEVVEAILHSSDFTFSDLTRATAYFKRRADFGVFTNWCAARGLNALPVVSVQSSLCRDDLLFELEADAWKTNQA